MDNKKKWLIGLGALAIVLIGLIVWRLNTSSNLDDHTKDKSDNQQSAIDHKEQKVKGEEDTAKKEEDKESKSKDKEKKGALTTNPDADKNVSAPKKNDKEAPKKPDDKDLESKAKKFVEIQVTPKTPKNVKDLKSQFSKIATKSLTDRVFGDQVEAGDENANYQPSNIQIKVVKADKKNQQVEVKYDVKGKSSETHKMATLHEGITQSVWFKYEDGQFKVDNFKQ